MRLSRCLSDLGVADSAPFAECDGVGEEFRVLKKIYFEKILREHPDKGGDAATFRATRAAWQVLRDLYEKGSIKDGTFASYVGSANAADKASGDEDSDSDSEFEDDDLADLYEKYSANTSTPSYEFYAAAAEEEAPGYRVEPAKSGRSTCKKCGTKIDKGGIRVGSLDKVSGTYGRWAKLDCWRVPVKVQNGLTDPSDEEASLRDLLSMEDVLLTGVGALDDASQRLFVQHCVDSDHWARGKKRKHKQIQGGSIDGAMEGSTGKKGRSEPPTAASAAGGPGVAAGSFAVLVPGVDGALGDERYLRGKTFVISGTFPEVGGGDADAVGVANVKAMVQSFGGKVITRFSKNTNFLLVGKDAVASKFKDATSRHIDVIGLRRLQGLLLGHVSFQELKGLPVLTSDMFAESAYQAVGAPPPPEGRERPHPSASTGATSETKETKPAAVSEASKTKVSAKPKKPKPVAVKVVSSSNTMVARAQAEGASASAIIPHAGKKAKFRIPRPGINGAVAGVLEGKTFVLTGIFPELGGGAGLSLGKDRTKSMIESFGGRVTSAVSGKTNFVLVGKDPGRSKVSQADSRGIPLVDLLGLQRLLLGQTTLEDAASEPPPRITNFSAGYPGQMRLGW